MGLITDTFNSEIDRLNSEIERLNNVIKEISEKSHLMFRNPIEAQNIEKTFLSMLELMVGAKEISLNKRIDGAIAMGILWELEPDFYNAPHGFDPSQFLYEFCTKFSDRLTVGKIRELRQKMQHDRITWDIKEKEYQKQIKDLERYKIAWEMKKEES